MLKKLRIRFISLSVVIFAVMLGIIFGLIYYFTAENLESQSLIHMETVLNSRSRMSNKLMRGDENRTPTFTIEMTSLGSTYIVGSSYYDLSDENVIGELMTHALNTSEQSGVIREYGLRYLRRATPLGWTVAFADITGERQMLDGLIRDLVLIELVGIALFFGASIFFARWATKPVETAWKQQQQFVADASHELKTPLAVIMSNAELMQTSGYSEAERAHFGESILIMSRKMRELVERLLDLARADNGQIKTTFEPLDYSTLVSDAVLPFEALFFEKELMLESTVAPDIRVNGSANYLRQTVEILLDNAQKYSLPGTVTLTLEKHDRTHCLLTVKNPGEDMSAEELRNIFKRFYRADKARSSDSGSYGLGLAIAESIVAEHGGKIWAESKSGTVSFNILLPTI